MELELSKKCLICTVCFLLGKLDVHITQHLHNDKHGNCVPSTTHVVGEEPIVQCKESLIGCHFPHGLQDSLVGELAGGLVGFLTRHPVLAGLQANT